MGNMIPRVEREGHRFLVPIYGTSGRYCWIEWMEGEGVDSALSRACNDGSDKPWVHSTFKVWSNDMSEQNAEDLVNSIDLYVYEVECCVGKERYFLISDDVILFSCDILNCVCVPYNRLNLLKFYSEFVCTIGQTRYRN